MTDTSRCPQCRAPLADDAPAGLCPKCLVEAGFETATPSEPPADGAPGPRPGQRFDPPSVEALRSLFPQLEVLELIVRGLPLQEVASVLGVSRNTVASHVKGIYLKLEVSSRGEAVFEALNQGLVKIEPLS